MMFMEINMTECIFPSSHTVGVGKREKKIKQSILETVRRVGFQTILVYWTIIAKVQTSCCDLFSYLYTTAPERETNSKNDKSLVSISPPE